MANKDVYICMPSLRLTNREVFELEMLGGNFPHEYQYSPKKFNILETVAMMAWQTDGARKMQTNMQADWQSPNT